MDAKVLKPASTGPPIYLSNCSIDSYTRLSSLFIVCSPVHAAIFALHKAQIMDIMYGLHSRFHPRVFDFLLPIRPPIFCLTPSTHLLTHAKRLLVLVSNDGDFALGFFSPTDSNSGWLKWSLTTWYRRSCWRPFVTGSLLHYCYFWSASWCFASPVSSLSGSVSFWLIAEFTIILWGYNCPTINVMKAMFWLRTQNHVNRLLIILIVKVDPYINKYLRSNGFSYTLQTAFFTLFPTRMKERCHGCIWCVFVPSSSSYSLLRLSIRWQADISKTALPQIHARLIGWGLCSWLLLPHQFQQEVITSEFRITKSKNAHVVWVPTVKTQSPSLH